MELINYLHAHNFEHGRLNIDSFSLLDTSADLRVALTDYRNLFLKEALNKSTFRYVAPELVLDNGSSKKGDIWAFGVIAL